MAKAINDIKAAYNALNTTDQRAIKTALRRGATRRDVMGYLMAAGATIFAAGSMVDGAIAAVSAIPKRGGAIRFAYDVHGPADTLNPTLAISSLDFCRLRLNYNSLTRLQEDLTVRPELAEEFHSNADATEWTFKLRSGVRFHDGSVMTADDVLYSMNLHMGANSISVAQGLFSDVKEWIKIDSQTVKVVLNTPNVEIPIVVATFHFKIVKDGTTDFSMPTGTGPYKLSEFSPGVRSVHIRNDEYWNVEAGPYLEQIEVFAITDNMSRLYALRSGDIHMMGNLDPSAVPQVDRMEGIEVFTGTAGSYSSIVARSGQSPGNDPDFVLALKHLQRRDRILNVIQKGYGDIANDQPIGPAYANEWCSDLPTKEYNPDKAKFYLKKSGITSAKIDVAELDPGTTDSCLILQRECSKVGLDLSLNRVPNEGYYGTVWGKTPFNVGSWNMRPTASMLLNVNYKSNAPLNDSAFKNERFDSLLSRVRGETNPSTRKEMHCEMQKLISDHAGTLIGTYRPFVDAKISKLKGFPRLPTASFGGMEWPEYAWLDD